jgi:hypothetical protein
MKVEEILKNHTLQFYFTIIHLQVCKMPLSVLLLLSLTVAVSSGIYRRDFLEQYKHSSKNSILCF